MAQPEAFSLMRAAHDIHSRKGTTDAAVEAAAPSGGQTPGSAMMAGKERALNMGGAPSGAPKQSAYGAPIQPRDGSPAMAGSVPAVEEEAEAAPVVEQPQQLIQDDDGSITGIARNARESARRQNRNIATKANASADEQADYERATGVLSQVLYEDPKTSTAIIDSLQPENKVGSVAQTAILLLKQLDEKADFDEATIPQLTGDIVDRLIDLGEQTKGMQFSDEEAQGALGAAWEGVMQIYGTGDENDFTEATQDMSDDDLKGHTAQYRKFLGSDF